MASVRPFAKDFLDRVRDRGRRLFRRFPSTQSALASSRLYRKWWYYSIELLPGLITAGQYPPDLPMLPRLMLRRCGLDGAAALDVGCMEGLIPTLMCKGGASDVLALDAVDHCVKKLDAVRHYHGVDFDYRSVGLMYDLAEKLPGRGFDVINCSGLLYHVFSPIHVLCGLRALLKRGGLMIVSTNVTVENSFLMEFNECGRMQAELNTFWYPTVKLLDYLLRYLCLAPIDCIFVPHTDVHSDVRYVFDKASGYISILCRAVEEPLATSDDEWMRDSARHSWEYRGLVDWRRAERQPTAKGSIRGQLDRRCYRADLECLDLHEAIRMRKPLPAPRDPSGTHVLRLAERE